MKKFKTLSLAMAVTSSFGLLSQANALELGEFKGTTFSVGGYVKAEGIFNDADSGADNFEGNAHQSRINFKASKNVDGHKVTGFVEGDFYGGDNRTDYRLRHAYVKVDNLTVGQTWTGQFLAMAPFDAQHLDFWNAARGTAAGNGGVVRPDVVLHYQMGNIRFSLQEPINEDANYPDFVINYTKRFEGGHAVSTSIAGRDIAKSNTTNNSEDSEFGAALLLAGKYNIGSTTLHASGYTGEGQGVYAGFGYAGAWHPTLRPSVDANSSGELIKTTGIVTAISHKFSKDLRGVVRYSQIEADETTTGTDDTLEMAHVNLVYSYMPGVDFGIEWRDQNFATHPTRPAGQQVELMAMYKF
jgi:hypothetical protein|tara:strand:+ start:10178 stop:11245 length:1068 start_codon:yes stop_codon:yes gene_type:complete